jgi:hypothetical protein
MGKKSKEHKKRVQTRNARLDNPVARKVVTLASHNAVVKELRKAETSDQIAVLNSQVASTDPSKLRKAITSKAPKEMDKGIKKLQKAGKDVSVDALCSEITTTPGFLSMCEQVGLDLSWFEKLAKERMEANGL